MNFVGWPEFVSGAREFLSFFFFTVMPFLFCLVLFLLQQMRHLKGKK